MKDLLFLRKQKLKGQQKQMAKLNGQRKRAWDLAKSEKSGANISTTRKKRTGCLRNVCCVKKIFRILQANKGEPG
jgi:hypothetical protein